MHYTAHRNENLIHFAGGLCYTVCTFIGTHFTAWCKTQVSSSVNSLRRLKGVPLPCRLLVTLHRQCPVLSAVKVCALLWDGDLSVRLALNNLCNARRKLRQRVYQPDIFNTAASYSIPMCFYQSIFVLTIKYMCTLSWVDPSVSSSWMSDSKSQKTTFPGWQRRGM